MTEPTAATPNAPESAQPDPSVPAEAPQSDEVQPSPTIIVLTEEALKPVDVDKIVALH